MSESRVPDHGLAHLRRIRSFVRREGRMTDGQKTALERLWPRYGLDAPAAPCDLAQVFGRSAPVVFEIGFGNGDHLLARAQSEPQHDFIGVEVHRPGVGRLLHNAEKAGLNNLRAACHDAVEVLEHWIVDGALHEAVIYFPDPWHKKRHNKRRLVQPAFVDLLARKIHSGGRLLLATDWAPYAAHMLEVLNAAPGFVNVASDGRYVPRHPTRPKTRFEARGERLGHEVFDLEFRRL
ncbi:MAG: tRNA (guanosine(46)-N7)-methyltransferase TrmB [Nevskiaceae bacterium]|nr:MAG: tRNA (guanosine(46)-N7)-methyltransferase TrmB [Nevskiaceae bacterium]